MASEKINQWFRLLDWLACAVVVLVILFFLIPIFEPVVNDAVLPFWRRLLS